MRYEFYGVISPHRGHGRVWFQGARLTAIGANPGLPYTVTYDTAAQQLTVTLSDTGYRRVSRKGDSVPVIDISNSEVDATLGAATRRIHVVFEPGRITIAIHPDERAAQERLSRVAGKIAGGEPLALGSACHGAGILDHALHRGLDYAGVHAQLAFAIEMNARYLETSLRNNPLWHSGSLAICAEVADVDTTRLPQVDVVVCGLPCEGSSLAGRSRRNTMAHAEEHRSASAFVFVVGIVRHCQPAILVLENVTQFATTPSYFLLQQCLLALGYELHLTTIVGDDMGALEARRRLCVVAVTRGIHFSWDQLQPTRPKEARLGEVLDPPGTEHRWSACEGLRAKEVRDRQQYAEAGNGPGFPMQIVTADAASVPVVTKGYSRWRSTDVKLQHPTHPRLLRQLSVREHAAVKTIPAGLVAGEVPTTQHEMLGQSVIHAAFEAVGRTLGTQLREQFENAAASDCATDGWAVPDLDGRGAPSQGPSKQLVLF